MSGSDFLIVSLEFIPARLAEIADPPTQLFVRGELPDPEHYAYLAVVGSREYTPYGRQSCERLIAGLRGYPVCIVSGLALGIDGIAHTAALEAGLPSVGVPGSGLDDRVLYPAAHRALAHRILKEGGALLSEFPADWRPRPESFPQRNRIMAGLCRAVLVIEATTRSGTLITSRLAAEYNRDVLAVPGPIGSVTSAGPHMLIKKGAACITSSADILEALGIAAADKHEERPELSDSEARVAALLTVPRARDELVRELDVPSHEANALLAAMEIKGLIEERLGLISLT